MKDEHVHSYGTGLAPTCDRCGEPPDYGALMDGALTVVCFRCLTADELRAFKRGEAVALVRDPSQ